MTAMAPSLLTYLENYHWKDYSVNTVVDHSNTRMRLHKGSYPLHRLCRNVELGRVPFNLVEACVWVYGEKWNIVWTDDASWLPADVDVITRNYLPHGFHKVLFAETDQEYLNLWIEVCGRGFYPFAAEIRHHGYACWANSRRFAIVAQSPQQCTVIAELMHAYNILGNRIEIYTPRTEGIALTDSARSGNAVHEDDRSCFDFRGSQECLDAIAGRFPEPASASDRNFLLGEGVRLLQRQHNERIHEANQAIYRVQQSWQALHDAYAALLD